MIPDQIQGQATKPQPCQLAIRCVARSPLQDVLVSSAKRLSQAATIHAASQERALSAERAKQNFSNDQEIAATLGIVAVLRLYCHSHSLHLLTRGLSGPTAVPRPTGVSLSCSGVE